MLFPRDTEFDCPVRMEVVQMIWQSGFCGFLLNLFKSTIIRFRQRCPNLGCTSHIPLSIDWMLFADSYAALTVKGLVRQTFQKSAMRSVVGQKQNIMQDDAVRSLDARGKIMSEESVWA